MRIFGEDPEISKLLRKQIAYLEARVAGICEQLDTCRALKEALQKENAELKDAALRMKEELLKLKTPPPPRDPFANFPAALRAQIDYKALGLEEPE